MNRRVFLTGLASLAAFVVAPFRSAQARWNVSKRPRKPSEQVNATVLYPYIGRAYVNTYEFPSSAEREAMYAAAEMPLITRMIFAEFDPPVTTPNVWTCTRFAAEWDAIIIEKFPWDNYGTRKVALNTPHEKVPGVHSAWKDGGLVMSYVPDSTDQRVRDYYAKVIKLEQMCARFLDNASHG
jgi:hypothetical protein